MLAAGGKAGRGQAVAARALAGREHLEDATHRQPALIALRGQRAVSLRPLLRLVERNSIKFSEARHRNRRHGGQERLFAHVGPSLIDNFDTFEALTH